MRVWKLQTNSDVADVGIGGTRLQQATGTFEKMIGVVLLEIDRRVELLSDHYFNYGSVDEAAGSVGWPVFTVRSSGENKLAFEK